MTFRSILSLICCRPTHNEYRLKPMQDHVTTKLYSLELKTPANHKNKGSLSLDVIIDWDEKVQSNTIGICLYHGAGGDMYAGNLPLFANRLAALGFPVLRYTKKGTSVDAKRSIAETVINEAPKQIPQFKNVKYWILAGHSMGGRVACQLASQLKEKKQILGLLLFSYPVHPPKKTEELRQYPICDLDLPLLFVRGTKDPFSEEKQWKFIQGSLKSHNVTIHTVQGGDHKLRVPGGESANAESLQKICEVIEVFTKDLVRDVVDSPGNKFEKSRKDSGGDASDPHQVVTKRAKKTK